jgi:hypothetical protein
MAYWGRLLWRVRNVMIVSIGSTSVYSAHLGAIASVRIRCLEAAHLETYLMLQEYSVIGTVSTVDSQESKSGIGKMGEAYEKWDVLPTARMRSAAPHKTFAEE